MRRNMLIDAAHPEEVRVCVLENGAVEDFDFESSSRKPLRGNIYLARVTRVEPSLQAAFVEYGGNRHGFLAFNEIHPDYYQIPISDRRILQEAEAEEAALAAELDLGQRGDEDGEDEFDLPVETRADDDAADFRDNVSGADAGEEHSAADNDDEGDAREAEADDDASEGDPVETGDAGSDESASAPREAALSSGRPESIEEAHHDAPVSDDVDETSSAETTDAAGDLAVAEPLENGSDRPQGRGAKRGELLERYKEARRKRARLVRNYKIQEVVKRRQILLIQVVKEERGNKGAAVTTYLSLAGRYCVLMPNTARGGGISRKIPVAADRKRLRRVVDSLELPQGMGLIIRTAGAKRTKAEVKRDYDYLIRLWETIRTQTLMSIAPCLIYEEANLIKRAIRDLYDKDIDSILVEGDAGYREAKDFMKMLMPSHAKNVQPYKEKTPLFLKYDVEGQLDAIYQPTVRLKSGGYMVIHQTEALVAIDVNSGKSTRERNIELTALKTNLEAAKEAARQCRLRDLAGLIVIDFIDMEENKNNRSVEKKLKDALRTDRARIQIGRISNFGLLEMSRQRRRSGLVDGTTHACPTCGGAGVVRSHEMASLRILRSIEGQALQARAAVIAIKTSPDVALYILNHKRAWLKRIEDDYALSIEIIADNAKAGDQYEIEKRGAPRELPAAPAIVHADIAEIDAEPDSDAETDDADDDAADAIADATADDDIARSSEGEGGGRKRRRRRRKRRDDPADAGQSGGAESSNGEARDASREAAGEEEETPPEREPSAPRESADGDAQKKRRRRGRRGGRRNSRRTENVDAETAAPDSLSGLDEASIAAADAGESDHAEPSRRAETSGAPAPESNYSSAPDRPIAAPRAEPSPAEERAPAPPLPDALPEAARRARAYAEPATADPEESPQRSEAKSTRKGWWQRAIGG